MPRDLRAVDLFAGPLPGGWDLAATGLGLDPLGIEWDDAACQTREANGLRTLQADVATLDPADFAPCDLLVASPPCQAWSMAGQRKGEQDIARVHALTAAIAGRPTGQRRDSGPAAERTPRGIAQPSYTIRANGSGTAPAGVEWTLDEPDDWADPRSRLVTEPIRWIKALHPTFVALEQVPPVLDYWHVVAGYLREWGYAVWTGVLSSERYGVPQTRKRAILMASLDGPVHPPRPTHQAYVPGEPARHEHTLEGELLPWVSMAEALGWAGSDVMRHNQAERDRPRDEQGKARVRRADGGDYYLRFPAERPAPHLTTQAAAWKREIDVPAPTVTAGGTASGGPEPFGRGGRERINRALSQDAGSGHE